MDFFFSCIAMYSFQKSIHPSTNKIWEGAIVMNCPKVASGPGHYVHSKA